MTFRVAAAAFFLCLSFWSAQTKIYDRCELARELRDVHEFPENQLATWLCIANYESHFNTSAHNPGSGDHGIFQISELYWCSPPGNGYACGLPCSALKDDDIEDDAICARRIYRQHQRISGDGFTAWVVYNLHCRNPTHADSFLQGCFDEENLVKYGYQPIYEAMNLPTMRVPMPTSPPSPPPSAASISPMSSPLPSSSPVQPSPTTKLPPAKTSTVQIKPTIVNKVSQKPITTPKPQISTYKPLPNLSVGFASSAFSRKPIQVSTFTAVSSNFQASPVISVKSSVPSSTIAVSTNKPQLSTIQTLFTTSPKPAVPNVNKISTYKPVTPTLRVYPAISFKPSTLQHPIKFSTYKPISSTFTTTIKLTTPKPEISTYKPFLNRFSSTFQTSVKSSQKLNEISSTFRTSPLAATSRPPTAISTYRPFLNQFSMGYKPQISSFSTPKQISVVASSGLTASPFISSGLYINNDGSNKATVVKPRETKNVLPFTLKSGVNPFEFKRDETVYAFVNNPGYSFAISSHGFKFLRTGD